MSEMDQQAAGKIEASVAELAAVAARMGVEFNEEAARAWIAAMSSATGADAFAQDPETGIFGHRVSLLDFDRGALDYFRRLAQKVRAASRPYAESAIAIAGSSAQGRVQLFPGDTDFFERLNLKAASERDARAALREIMRETALRALAEPDIVLVEVNFGVYPTAVVERGVARGQGDSINWTPADVVKGAIEVTDAAGRPLVVRWDEAEAGLGWTYLGWIVADREAGRMVQASNMLDVTWEAPDGQIVALDGSIDPFFQEVYLEPGAAALFHKVTKAADNGALSGYVQAMRWQVFHYTHEELNFGKAAKRMYNLFRLTDQLEAAAYVRELFDEPTAKLYQVPGLLEAVEVAREPGSGIERDTVIDQIDQVIRAVVEASDGPEEVEMVMSLIRLRDEVMGRARPGVVWGEVLGDVRRRCSVLINEFFRSRLLGLPRIASYVEQLTAQ
jgi:hypothetical protein